MQCNRYFVDASSPLRFIPFRTSSAMQRSFILTLLLLLSAFLFCSTVALAEETLTTAPAVKINPAVGPPTTTVLVSGTGFDPYAAVDIYFDTSDLALATTNGAGTLGGGSLLGGIAIQAPASAVPGRHWITAVERYTLKAAQTSFLVRTDWAQFRYGPERKAVNPYENVLGPATVGGMTLLWSAGTNAVMPSAPVVAGGRVFVGTYWHILHEDDGEVLAFNTSGALLWSDWMHAAVWASPAVSNGMVYAGTANMPNSAFYALDAGSGGILWKDAGFYAVGDSSPAIANGMVYFCPASSIWALDASTGGYIWGLPMSGWCSSPAVANGIVYVHSDLAFHAFNARTGVLLWEYDVPGWSSWSSPAVANGLAYVGSGDGNLYAFNASTGAQLWKYQTGGALSSPAVANGMLYVGSGDGNLYALNGNTGSLVWNYPTTGAVSEPVVANGVVYVASTDQELYALNAKTGALLWQYTTGNDFFTSPVVADGVVYVGSDTGSYNTVLWAFGLPSDVMSDKFSPPARPDAYLLQPDWKLRPSAPTTKTPSDSQGHVE
jgi:outer membrane protein assembly factor BamB